MKTLKIGILLLLVLSVFAGMEVLQSKSAQTFARTTYACFKAGEPHAQCLMESLTPPSAALLAANTFER